MPLCSKKLNRGNTVFWFFELVSFETLSVCIKTDVVGSKRNIQGSWTGFKKSVEWESSVLFFLIFRNKAVLLVYRIHEVYLNVTINNWEQPQS